MFKKSVFSLFALLIVASMLLAACGTPAEVTEARLLLPTEAPQPTEVPQPSVFIFGRGGDSVQLDPIVVTDGESYRVTGQILESLYTFEPGTTIPTPNLAEECIANEDRHRMDLHP